MSADHYVTLGIDRAATVDEIRRAYRKLAAKLHPDRNPGNREAEATFRRISEAYEVLSDSAKRAAYDLAGRSPLSPGMTVQVHRSRKGGRVDMAADFKRAMKPGTVYMVRPSGGRVGPVPVVSTPEPAMPEVPLWTRRRR